MLLKLILLLTVTPIVELYILMRVGQVVGLPVTIVIVIGTGIVGGILARLEGLRVLGRIQGRLGEGDMPGDSLLEGAMILVAGALLVTPGILTDTVGFLILIPPSRVLLRELLKRWLKHCIETGRVEAYRNAGFGPIHREPPPGSPPLEENDDE
ncbi:MAG: FxsA family protein [Planctomycetota bacterium]